MPSNEKRRWGGARGGRWRAAEPWVGEWHVQKSAAASTAPTPAAAATPSSREAPLDAELEGTAALLVCDPEADPLAGKTPAPDELGATAELIELAAPPEAAGEGAWDWEALDSAPDAVALGSAPEERAPLWLAAADEGSCRIEVAAEVAAVAALPTAEVRDETAPCGCAATRENRARPMA